MNPRLPLIALVSWGVLSQPVQADAPASGPAGVIELRPVVTVLLEDLHNQSRAGGTEGKAYFGHDKLKETLEQSGAEVSSTLGLLATVTPAERKLTPDLLSRFDVVISNGRYPVTDRRTVEFFSKDEIEALDDYMKHGGILFMSCAGAALGKGCEPPLYNPMLKGFGVQVALDDINGAPEVAAVKSLNHPLIKDLPALKPFFPTTLVVTNHEAKTLFKLDGRPMMVLIPHGKGALIVAGGGSGWMNQSLENNLPSCAEPQKKFLRNLMEWASQRMEAKQAAVSGTKPTGQ